MMTSVSTLHYWVAVSASGSVVNHIPAQFSACFWYAHPIVDGIDIGEEERYICGVHKCAEWLPSHRAAECFCKTVLPDDPLNLDAFGL